MTTVAWDGKWMACDGLAVRGSAILAKDEVKIVVGPHGVAGYAGDRHKAERYANCLVTGSTEYAPDFDLEKDDIHILYVDEHGTGWDITERKEPRQIKAPYAIGSGGDFAEGAMLAGASVTAAVEIAMRRDLYTGGTIHVEACPLGKDGSTVTP